MYRLCKIATLCMQRRPEVAASSKLQEGTPSVTHKEPATGNQNVVVGSSIASASVKPQPDKHKLPGRQPKQPAVSASQSTAQQAQHAERAQCTSAQHAQQAKQTDQQHPKPRAAFSRATKQMPSADKPPTGQLQRTPRQAQHAQHTPRQTQHAQRAPRQAAAGKASAKVALPAETLQNSKVMQAAGTTQPLQPSTDLPPTSVLAENHQAVRAARHAQLMPSMTLSLRLQKQVPLDNLCRNSMCGVWKLKKQQRVQTVKLAQASLSEGCRPAEDRSTKQTIMLKKVLTLSVVQILEN